jgi:hypothetical protein
MKLKKTQSEQLLREHGIWVTEACDRCGKLLGAIRWTRRGEPGEWCSKLCRDGEAAVAQHKARKGGRPKKYRDEKERKKANTRYQQEFRLRECPNVRKTTPQPTGTEGFAGTILASEHVATNRGV